MGRIRTIKPEFPQSESIGRLSRDARLLFIQIWTLVDDEGRTRGNATMLASLLYPYDTDAVGLIEGWTQELEGEGCIARYRVGKDSYVQVTNWRDHQKIDKPSKSKLPPPSQGSANPREDSETEWNGMEGIGKDSSGMETPAGANPSPSLYSFGKETEAENDLGKICNEILRMWKEVRVRNSDIPIKETLTPDDLGKLSTWIASTPDYLSLLPKAFQEITATAWTSDFIPHLMWVLKPENTKDKARAWDRRSMAKEEIKNADLNDPMVQKVIELQEQQRLHAQQNRGN